MDKKTVYVALAGFIFGDAFAIVRANRHWKKNVKSLKKELELQKLVVDALSWLNKNHHLPEDEIMAEANERIAFIKIVANTK